MERPPKLPWDATVLRDSGADKRFRAPITTLEPRVIDLINQVKEHGYVTIHDAFTREEILEAKDTISRLSLEPQTAGPAAMKGRTVFEGLKTQRIYALADKSRVFDRFALHPDVLALNDYFLDPGYLLSTLQSINIMPGEKGQTLHHDDGYVSVPRPRQAFGTAIVIALDNFTATNGATVVVRDSHTWGSDRKPQGSEARPVVMPSGGILYYLGTLYHGGGPNTSDAARLALTTQYCQPWLRPFENLILAVEWDKLDDIPPRLVDLMGYKVGAPFVGHVDGTSRRAAVTRKMAKMRGGGRGGKPTSNL